MKVCTDGCLFGAWIGEKVRGLKYEVRTVLDIGAGTGLLSLMVAQKTNAVIDAVEIDEAAAGQAFENMDASPWRERLQVICGDIKTVHLGKKYDLIISNPPFFENDLKSEDDKRNLALHSEALGFEELITVIGSHLEEKGLFAVLLPYHRKDYFIELALINGFFLMEEVSVKQTTSHPFFRSILLFGKTGGTAVLSTIIIRDRQEYSVAFTDLLREYYLKL
jgi:tRNA1Val (adenine37-N6)-methyltransferase